MNDALSAAAIGDPYTLRCGSLHIARRTRQLRRDGQPVALGSRALDLLLALIDGRGAPQSAARLKALVWPDRAVGDNNLRVQMTHLRRLLGEQAIVHRVGHGYELVLPVQADEAPAEPAPAPGNLPMALWPLTGRDDALAQLDAQLVPGCRLTLLGPGGAGKTALALAAATQAAPRFAHGAWWVDLAPLSEGGQVVPAINQALGLAQTAQDPLAALARALAATPQRLLLLDNAEHLRAAVSEVCDRLLRASPQTAVLVTSRLPVGQGGEQPWPLPPLSLPDPAARDTLAAASASGAVRLLESRARCMDPRFRLTADNAAALLDICRRLDGHALALTLAAARLPVLGLQALRAGLDERLRWTQQATPGSAAPQHLSLQGTLDWSCALLPAAQQQLLRRLGMFRGLFSLDAMLAVAAAGAPALAAGEARLALEGLVAHGLVTLDGSGLLQAREAAARYTLHESTRLHARQQLHAAGEDAAVQAALGAFLFATLHTLRHSRSDQERAEALALMPDAQQVIEWATVADPTLATRLCDLAVNPLRRSGQHHLARRLAAPLIGTHEGAVPAAARASLLLQLCLIEFELDHHDTVLAHCEHVLRLLRENGDPEQHGLALSWQANVLGQRSQRAEAVSLYQQALQDFRDAGSSRRVCETLNNLGWTLQSAGRADEARPLLHEALAISRAMQDDWSRMVAHENLSELEMGLDQPAAALVHLEALAVLARRHPDLYRLGQACAFTALACARTGALRRACDAADEALRVTRQQGSRRLQSLACSTLALVLLEAGQPGRARSVLTLARRMRHELGLAAEHFVAASEDEVARRSGEMMTPQELQAAEIHGELLALDDAQRWAAEARVAAGG